MMLGMAMLGLMRVCECVCVQIQNEPGEGYER